MTPSLPRVTRTGAAALPYPAYDDDDDAPLLAGLGAAAAGSRLPPRRVLGVVLVRIVHQLLLRDVRGRADVGGRHVLGGRHRVIEAAVDGGDGLEPAPRRGRRGPNDWLDPNEAATGSTPPRRVLRVPLIGIVNHPVPLQPADGVGGGRRRGEGAGAAGGGGGRRVGPRRRHGSSWVRP